MKKPRARTKCMDMCVCSARCTNCVFYQSTHARHRRRRRRRHAIRHRSNKIPTCCVSLVFPRSTHSAHAWHALAHATFGQSVACARSISTSTSRSLIGLARADLQVQVRQVQVQRACVRLMVQWRSLMLCWRDAHTRCHSTGLTPSPFGEMCMCVRFFRGENAASVASNACVDRAVRCEAL